MGNELRKANRDDEGNGDELGRLQTCGKRTRKITILNAREMVSIHNEPTTQ